MNLAEVLLILVAEAFVLLGIVLLLRMAAEQDRVTRCARNFARRARIVARRAGERNNLPGRDHRDAVGRSAGFEGLGPTFYDLKKGYSLWAAWRNRALPIAHVNLQAGRRAHRQRQRCDAHRQGDRRAEASITWGDG